MIRFGTAEKSECLERVGKLAAHALIISLHGPTARDDNNIVADIQLRQERTVALAQSAAHAVSDDGTAELCADSQTQTILAQAISQAVHRAGASGRTLTAIVEPSKFVVFG